MFLRNWFGLGVRVSAELQDQIDTWKAIAAPPAETPIQEMRCVVLDTETSGLDTRQDEHGQLGQPVAGEHINMAALDHLPGGRQPVAEEA